MVRFWFARTAVVNFGFRESPGEVIMKKQAQVVSALVLFSASAAHAQQAVQWRVEDGGNGHWYVLSLQHFASWDEARLHAGAVGGHLATITSKDEQAFVRALVMSSTPAWEGECWLGGFQDPSASDFGEPGGGWRWVTGEPWIYSEWLPGQPDNAEPGSDVLFVSTLPAAALRWSDRTRQGYARTVIEWSTDCNNDGVVDHGQIRAGLLTDRNLNGVPDACEDLSQDILVPADYPSIQQAIDAAADGNIIQIAAGTFPVVAPITTRGKAVTLRGTLGAGGIPATLIDGGEVSSLLDCISGEGPGTRFEDLCFQRGAGISSQPVRVLGSSPTFVRCVVRDCRTPLDGTVVIYGGAPLFLGCSFLSNSAGAGGAVAIAYTSPIFRNCIVSNNVCVSYGGAFYCSVNGRVALDGCLVSANTAGYSGGAFRFAVAGSGLSRNTRVCGNAPDNGGPEDYGLNCYADDCAACTGDFDGDGIPNDSDNCPLTPNPEQEDCDLDNVGDACSPLGTDCDQNGVFDTCQIAAGASDINQNWVLDSCECIADLFIDQVVDGVDLGVLLAYWGPTTSASASQRSDVNRDGAVDGIDLGYLLSRWGPCSN
jgi:hypothetical protein